MRLKLILLVLILIVGLPVSVEAKASNYDVVQLRLYQSSSPIMGNSADTLICDVNTIDASGTDLCGTSTQLQPETSYRVEIKIFEANSGNSPTAYWNYTTWSGVGALVSCLGTVDTSSTACRYTTAQDPPADNAGTAADGCSYSSGTITFATSATPNLDGGGYAWASVLFTTGTIITNTTTILDGALNGASQKNPPFDNVLVNTGAVGLGIESFGPGCYGWQQVYTGTTSRLTASVDREYYDYGYKPIQVYARLEDYWAQDCGWWYTSNTKTVDVTLRDGQNDVVGTWTNQGTLKGRKQVEHTWANTDDPGRWNVTVTDNTAGTNYANAFFYVRGQLNVTTITNSSNPTRGSQVTIYANITDHSGTKVNGGAVDNVGTSIPPNVTAYITGAGDNLVVELFDNGIAPDGAIDGEWTGQFTPQSLGDHKIIVKASDGHIYWVDGRGSTWLYVTGTFPYASLGLTFFDFQRIPGVVWEEMGLASLLGGFVAVIFIKKRRSGGVSH